MRVSRRCGKGFHTLRTEEKAGFVNHDDNGAGTPLFAQPIENTKIKKSIAGLRCIGVLRGSLVVYFG
jgi:hypothetical protein